jgi:hypothetical protein
MTSVADILKREAPAQTPLKFVQLDGQVVLKIVQHCSRALPQLVTGQLLGLDVGATLEVTDSFPFPVRQNGARSLAGAGAGSSRRPHSRARGAW